MKFTKKFMTGLAMVFIGLLAAFDNVSETRSLSIIIFWLAMLMAFCGAVMMFKGIEARKNGS
jgi:hypothetical protein